MHILKKKFEHEKFKIKLTLHISLYTRMIYQADKWHQSEQNKGKIALKERQL